MRKKGGLVPLQTRRNAGTLGSIITSLSKISRCARSIMIHNLHSAMPSVFVYCPDQPTRVCDAPGSFLPVPEFAQAFYLTVDTLFGWLKD